MAEGLLWPRLLHNEAFQGPAARSTKTHLTLVAGSVSRPGHSSRVQSAPLDPRAGAVFTLLQSFLFFNLVGKSFSYILIHCLIHCLVFNRR